MSEQKRAIALGFFDGVHIGHAALLQQTKRRAAEKGLRPAVLSFDVHPDNLVRGGEVALLNSADERKRLIGRLFRIDDVVLLHFDQQLMRMPWKDFADKVIDEMGAAHIVVGYDFCFGYRGEGTAGRLREYAAARGVGVDIVPPVTVDGRTVSSTWIRELLAGGEIELANRLLGHAHTLSDTVHTGYHLGTKLGTPTINMFFPAGVLVPRHGVYAARVFLDGEESHIAVTNIGVRPTVGGDGRVSVESYLLDYAGDLYGQQVRVEFCSFLRPETRFDSVEALAAQIRLDAEHARAWFAGQAEEKVNSTGG